MNTKKVQEALRTLALGLGELSEALMESEGQTTTPFPKADAAPQPAPYPYAEQETIGDMLFKCPAHGIPWTVQPAGVSKKTGKQYNAFWKCEAAGCDRRPDPRWLAEHPPRVTVTA